MDAVVKWTAIILTCSDKQWRESFQRELDSRQAKGQIDKDVILLTVEDPKSNVGSGGATVNALLTIAEYISAQKGYTVINADVIRDAYILILHNGRTYPYNACTRAFVPLPVECCSLDHNSMICSVDLLIHLMTNKIATKSPPGVWVCSTDMFFSVPDDIKIPWKDADVCVVSVPSSPDYCKDHGVYRIDGEGYVADILYQQDVEALKSCALTDGNVPVVCGIVYLSYPVSEKLLSFHVKPPLDACTYIGLDSGQPPLQLSLFFDVMLPMTTAMTESAFVSGERSSGYGNSDKSSDGIQNQTARDVRQMLWRDLNGLKIYPCVIQEGMFCYLNSSATEFYDSVVHYPLQAKLSRSLHWHRITHSWLDTSADVDESSTVINSVLKKNVSVGPRTLITLSHLEGRIQVGKESILLGLRLEDSNIKEPIKFADNIVVQGFHIHLQTLGAQIYVYTVHGTKDKLKTALTEDSGTFCNEPWNRFLERTGIRREDLWNTDMGDRNQTLLTTKLFPVFHITENVGLREILWLQGQLVDDSGTILQRWRSSWRLSLWDILKLVDIQQEFTVRRNLFYSISQLELSNSLLNHRSIGFRSLYNSAVVDEFSDALLSSLDTVAMTCNSVRVAARALANIADVLGALAGGQGALRSGPAANKAWKRAYSLLEANMIGPGVAALAKERDHWLRRPDLLVRAARHYEGAAQILVRRAVMTGKEFFVLEDCHLVPLGKWVTVTCPARLDLSGGWSDTPPITYEHGGAVCNVSITVNGQQPIGSRAKRIKEPELVLVIGSEETKTNKIVIRELTNMEDYCQPHAPGALLKAAFVCADIIHFSPPVPLSEQLKKYGGGFEVHSWSNLPYGSGLGTSSILAGAVMAAVLKAAGKACDIKGILHADQVGGLIGGVKLGLSEAKLPLYVDYKRLKVTPEVTESFNKKVFLIYTGKTRLARNLLQNVVRNWYASNREINETEDSLVDIAHQCAESFTKGNLREVGVCVDRYWELKKRVAPGCEPPAVTKLMSALRPHADGISLAGAGGGGFLYGLLKNPDSRTLLPDILIQIKGLEGAALYDACIDEKGLTLSVDN